MLPYQEQYVKNAAEVASLSNFHNTSAPDFETWYEKRMEAQARIKELRSENVSLLETHFFPVLDNLFAASEEELASLSEFAAKLMDWQNNLDPCICMLIHEALLSYYRRKKDRDGVIRELYLMGMGFYYFRQTVEGIEAPECRSAAFHNEMIFTEGSSYLRYFDKIENEETKGYIIRSFANIAICALDRHRRIQISAKTLKILQDPYYRNLAPSLPWDSFVKKTHQQMSSNRRILSSGGMTKDELAEILDSCYEIFKPQMASESPSIRWLWPYYDMEYTCGLADLKTTVKRLQKLIEQSPTDVYDVSSLYGSVQLPVFYGMLIRDNPSLRKSPECLRFVQTGYRKMVSMLLSCPLDQLNDYVYYLIDYVVSSFYELENGLTYKDLTKKLLQRYAGVLYLRSLKAGDLMAEIAESILDQTPSFFDDLPETANTSSFAAKKIAVLSYVRDAALFYDLGLMKMNLSRINFTRNLFEYEFEFYRLHTIAGYDDLRARPSTANFADVALGHHADYDGAGGFPKSYVRTSSPYRMVTDVASIVSYLLDREDGGSGDPLGDALSSRRGKFSPIVLSYLAAPELRSRVESILKRDGKEYYESLYHASYESTTEFASDFS